MYKFKAKNKKDRKHTKVAQAIWDKFWENKKRQDEFIKASLRPMIYGDYDLEKAVEPFKDWMGKK